MNRGLLVKAFRESWLGTLLFGLGLIAGEAIIVFALTTFGDELTLVWARAPFVQRILSGLLGTKVAGQIGPEMLTSIAWVHPVILALTWAHAIAYCTRVPAGEVDRGTIDVLLGMPISRRQLYLNETIVWLLSGVVIVAMLAAGNRLGSMLVAKGVPFDARRMLILTANLLCLYTAVGGLAWLASCLSNRRGRAVGLVFALLLASFLLNYLAQFWSVADRLSALSFLHYYRPLAILRDALWPTRDMLILLASGFIMWLAGGLIFARRDLATL
jgi:ABC-type transport system involved in multi-copper enzyme maturation permease subunit